MFNKLNLQNLLLENQKEHIKVIQDTFSQHINIVNASKIISQTIKNNKKIFICGNGGSAADSQHMAAELVCKFKKKRKAIPAIALNTDSSIITSVSNDFSYNYIYARQIEALANKNDCLIGISTSGNSDNVINAIKEAKKKKLKSIVLTGKDGGKVKNYADICIFVQSNSTARIQETHIFLIHFFCEYLDTIDL